MKNVKRRLTTLTLMMLMVFAMMLPAHAASMKLSKTKLTLQVGEKQQLKVKNNKKGKKVKWSSSKKAVASVSSDGIVKARKAGSAKITAKIGSKKLTCKVTVKEKKKTNPVPPIANEFRNDANFQELPNSINICPFHIWYENGSVIADCYVINGYNHAVYNVNVRGLSLRANNSQLFADANFGVINNGGAIGAHSYIRWRFIFSGNCVLRKDASLTGGIDCKYNITNNY